MNFCRPAKMRKTDSVIRSSSIILHIVSYPFLKALSILRFSPPNLHHGADEGRSLRIQGKLHHHGLFLQTKLLVLRFDGSF